MKREQSAAGLPGLDDLIADAQSRNHRPRITPSEAAGQALQNLLGGLGAGAALGALMFYVGAPYPLETGGVVAIVCAGGIMFVRSFADEALDVRRLRVIQSTAKRGVESAIKQRNAALDELDNMEIDRDRWRRVAEQTEHDLDNERVLRAQLQQRLADAPRVARTNYTTAKPDPEPQDVRDAKELMRSWYVDGVYISRPKANTLGWPDDRHAAAFDLLRRAGVAYTNKRQVHFTPESHDEAMRLLTRFLAAVKAQVEPLSNTMEDDYDDE